MFLELKKDYRKYLFNHGFWESVSIRVNYYYTVKGYFTYYDYNYSRLELQKVIHQLSYYDCH